MSSKIKHKTHSGAKKRFKLTATGKVKRHHGGAAHLMTKKKPKRIRTLRSGVILNKKAAKEIKRILGA